MPKEVDLNILDSGYACSNVLSQVRPEKWKITRNCFQSDSCKWEAEVATTVRADFSEHHLNNYNMELGLKASAVPEMH